MRRWCTSVLDRSLPRARIRPRGLQPVYGNLHQLEKACDVLVVDDLAVKVFKQRENHMRLEAFDLVAHALSSSSTPNGRTSCPAARSVLTMSYSVFHSLTSCTVYPLVESGGTSAGSIEHQDAQAFHSAIHLRRDGPNSACMVFAVNRTVKSISSFRSEPTARRSCSRHRAIMSSSTASSVSWFSPVHRATSFLMWARWRLMNTEAGCDRRCRGSAENSRWRSRS